MAKLWRYKVVSDRYTTYWVNHPSNVIVSHLGTFSGFDWFVAEDSYIPEHPMLTFEEVVPTQQIIDLIMANSPHAKLLQKRMAEGPPRYTIEDANRLALYLDFVPGLAEHIASGRAWDSN